MPEAKEVDLSDSQLHHATSAAILSENLYGGTVGFTGSADQPGCITLPMAPRKDVDCLVQEIKENLKLSHGLKSRSTAVANRSSHRASPYPRVPNPTRQCDNATAVAAVSGLKRWNHRRRYPSTCMNTGSSSIPGKKLMSKTETDDPFEMLQELISDKSLIKEAVRRLQLGLTPKFSTREFYDSDEDCRTPPAFSDLCCEVASM